MIEELLATLASQPAWLIYLVVGLGAAIENIFPPIPADTFVLFGAFLATRGDANEWIVLASTWTANVGSALIVYGLARRYGRSAFQTSIGRRILNPGQLERIGGFYDRFGIWAIFFSRFLPALRAVVPVFAGVSGFGFWRTAIPLAVASAAWYGLVVLVGTAAGKNWNAIQDLFGRFNTGFAIVGGLLLAAVAVWWWRSRHDHDHDREAGEA